MSTSVLHITYDGLLEPLGQSQVWQYVRRLARRHRITVLSFEKPADWADNQRRADFGRDVQSSGVEWIPLRYHKSPSAPATSFDIMAGIAAGATAMVRHKVRLIHARSYVPSVIALALKQMFRAKYLFDMRGFWADERVDGGLWAQSSRIYRLAKYFERQFMTEADAVVSLTHAGVRALPQLGAVPREGVPIRVIPTCADLEVFRPRGEAPPASPIVLGYVGTVGTWYLLEPVFETFQLLLRQHPDARLLIINRGEHELIQAMANRFGVTSSIEVHTAPHSEVPGFLRRMHAGIFFIKPVFSKLASAPTKLAEMLGAGLPCLTNAGVGDLAEIVRKHRVGVALERLEEPSLAAGLESLLRLVADPLTRERCVDTAQQLFSIDVGVEAYDSLYEDLAS